jgi:hypothetical protein
VLVLPRVAAGSGKSKGLNAYDPDYVDELLAFWMLNNSLVKQVFADNLEMQLSYRVCRSRALAVNLRLAGIASRLHHCAEST